MSSSVVSYEPSSSGSIRLQRYLSLVQRGQAVRKEVGKRAEIDSRMRRLWTPVEICVVRPLSDRIVRKLEARIQISSEGILLPTKNLISGLQRIRGYAGPLARMDAGRVPFIRDVLAVLITLARDVHMTTSDAIEVLHIPQAARNLVANVNRAAHEELIDAPEKDLNAVMKRFSTESGAECSRQIQEIRAESEAYFETKLKEREKERAQAQSSEVVSVENQSFMSRLMSSVRFARASTSQYVADRASDAKDSVAFKAREAAVTSVMVAKVAAFSATQEAGKAAAEMAREKLNEKSHEINLAIDTKENELNQKVVAKAIEKSVPVVMRFIVAFAVRFAVMHIFYRMLHEVVSRAAPGDNKHAESARKLFETVALTVNILSYILWIKVAVPAARDLHRAYQENPHYNPDQTTAGEISAVMGPKVSELAAGAKAIFRNSVGDRLPENFVVGQYLSRFAERVAEYGIELD